MDEFFELDPKLRKILCEVECFMYPQPMIVTCLMRTAEEQLSLFEHGEASDKTSVHMYGRGADVRLFEKGNEELLEHINQMFPYDSRRSHWTMMIHGGSARHIHLQTRPLAEEKVGT